MNNFLLPTDTQVFYKRYALFFTRTILFVLVSCIASFFLFPLQSGLISAFFTSFLLIPAIDAILEKNKNDIWQKRTGSFKANLDMTLSLFFIFLAVLLTFSVLVLLLPYDTVKVVFFSQIHDTMTHTHLITKEFHEILANRLMIVTVFFFVSLIFRVGGVFVLVWLASVWGVLYGAYFKQGLGTDLPVFKHYMVVMTFTGLSIFFLRTLSFITASMAGIFFSKGIGKYKLKSKEFLQVFRAVIIILFVSLLLLVLSVYWECHMYNTL